MSYFSYENMWATVIYTSIWNDGNCSLDRLAQLAWFSVITKVGTRPWECKKWKNCKWNLLDENSIHLTCLTDYSLKDWNTRKIVISVYKEKSRKIIKKCISAISAETNIWLVMQFTLLRDPSNQLVGHEKRMWHGTRENTVTPAEVQAGLAQSVERSTAEREVAGSIPGARPILRVLK